MTPPKPHSNAAGLMRTAFLMAFLAGATVIGASPFVPMTLPVLVGLPNAVMLVYLIGTVMIARRAALAELIADSVYQLGFLFTVVSLLASFLPMVLEPSATLSVEDTLARFAMALTTTLFGLIGRVVIRLFALTVDQAEAHAHAALTDRTQAFTEELALLVEKVQGTVERLNTDLAQTVDASVDGIRSASQTGIAELRDTAAAARESISHSTASMTEQFEDRMHQAFQRSAASIDSLSRSLEGLGDSTATILKPFSVEMTDMVAELKTLRESSARNEERITRIFETNDSMIAKLRETQEVGDRLQGRLGARISDVASALEGATRTVEGLAGDSRSIVGRLGQEIDTLRAARKAVPDDEAELPDVQARLSAELSATMDRADTHNQRLEIDGLAIEETAFAEINRPTPNNRPTMDKAPLDKPTPDQPGGDDNEVYIPSLASRLRRPR